MFQVYRIDTFEAHGNSHALGIRDENWILRRDKNFSTVEEAQEYVCMKSRQTTILPNILISLHESKREAFVKHFCFGDNEYWAERRYFLGKPDIKKIAAAHKRDGVKMIHMNYH